MELKFRKLKAHELEVRIDKVYSDGSCTMLLYTTARGCMKVLNEAVTPLGWKKRYREVVMQNGELHLTCEVSILDKDRNEWVSKENVGEPAKGPYKDKAQASDAFKRACFDWGIGTELYYAPTIYIPAGGINLVHLENGQVLTNDELTVMQIDVGETSEMITRLAIKNETTGKVFTFDQESQEVRAIKNEEYHQKKQESKMQPVLSPAPVKQAEAVAAPAPKDEDETEMFVPEPPVINHPLPLPTDAYDEPDIGVAPDFPSFEMPCDFDEVEEEESISDVPVVSKPEEPNMSLAAASMTIATVGKFAKMGTSLGELNPSQLAWVYQNAPEKDIKKACLLIAENNELTLNLFKAKNIL